MEPTKPARHKACTGSSKIIRYLPRAATFTVPSLPYSPGRSAPAGGAEASSRGPHHHHRSSFSGPISIIPAEARKLRPATGLVEPTSPKVSCIGQVKRHKDAACRAAKAANDAAAKKKNKRQAEDKAAAAADNTKKPPKFALMRLLRAKSSRSRSRAKDEREAVSPTGPAAPALGQLRRFSSGRTALAGFDWRSANVAICPVDPAVDVDSPEMDDELEEEFHGCYGDNKDDDSCKIPHSAPMVLPGAGAAATSHSARKQEVNLWKRRTMAPPKPLQLN